MIPAKSFAAGFAIAAGALAITYAALAVAYADRPAALDHWFYRELVVWQTGLGAFFGLLGLAAVAAWNFKKTRDRDKELRQEEARALARVICREMLEIRETCIEIRSLIEAYPDDPGDTSNMMYEWFQFSIVNVYEKLAPKLGILPPDLIDGVGLVYGNLVNLQQAADYFGRHSDDPRKAFDSLNFRIEKLSKNVERAAPGLAAFAGFTIAGDQFRAMDAAAKEAVSSSRAAMIAAADRHDQPD